MKEILLKAIIDEPDVDLHRLAYADWLEERAGDQTDESRVIRRGLANPGKEFGCRGDPEVGIFCTPEFNCQECHLLMARGVNPIFLCGDKRFIMKRGFMMAVHTVHYYWKTFGKELVKIQPVEAVVFRDLKPADVKYKSGGSRTYAWFVEHSFASSDEYQTLNARLPEWLMPVQGKRRCNYPTGVAAMRALSDRALVWAKSDEP